MDIYLLIWIITQYYFILLLELFQLWSLRPLSVGYCPFDIPFSCSFCFYKFILFIYFWLRWVFVAARGLSLVTASGGYSSLRCTGFSLRWLLLLRDTGTRRTGFSSCGTRALERSISSCGTRA